MIETKSFHFGAVKFEANYQVVCAYFVFDGTILIRTGGTYEHFYEFMRCMNVGEIYLASRALPSHPLYSKREILWLQSVLESQIGTTEQTFE